MRSLCTRIVLSTLVSLSLAAPALSQSLPRFGVGARVSTLGYGFEAATAVTSRTNVRGGFNIANPDFDVSKRGLDYVADVRLRSVDAHFDVFFGGVRISPGVLLYNGNRVEASATAPAGRIFTLGGRDYVSSAIDPVKGTGEFDLSKRAVSPMITVGTGNLLRRSGRRWSITFDAGVVFAGSPNAKLDLAGTTCATPIGICQSIASNPQIQADIRAEEEKFNTGGAPYDEYWKFIRYYPVISFGVGYRIK